MQYGQNCLNQVQLTLQKSAGKSFKLSRLGAAQLLISLGLYLPISVTFAQNPVDADIVTIPSNGGEQDRVILPTIILKAESAQPLAGQLANTSHVGFLGEKKYGETPFQTQAYTDKYIADRQAQEITDVIAATDASVFSNGVTGAWSENYYIRGFASSSGDMSMNGMFGISPFYRTSPEMFEQITVLKGPSALLNGMPPAGSIGGTVDLKTKRAGDQPLNRFTASYMSDSQFGGHIDVSRRFGENNAFGVRLNGVYRDGQGAVDDQEKKTELLSLGLDWRGERARISADLYTAEDRIDGVTRGINLATGITVPKPPKPTTLLNPDWSFVRSKDKGAMLRAEYDVNDQFMIYAAYGQSKTDYQYNGTMLSTVTDNKGTLDNTIGQLAFDLAKTSADVGLKGTFNTGQIGHQWVMNATYYQHDQNDYGQRMVHGAGNTTNIYHPVWGKPAELNLPYLFSSSLETRSYGIADTLSTLEDRLQLTLGLRHQRVKTASTTAKNYDQSAITPGAAIVFKVTDYMSIYANYIEGLSKGGQAPATAFNSDTVFAPQKTKQKEVGLKLEYDHFQHSLSVFEITQPNLYLDSDNYYKSDGEQRNRGVEWSFAGNILHDVRVLGGVTLLDPELSKTKAGINQGNVPTGFAKNQAKLGLEWDTVLVPNLTLTANMTAVSKQYLNQENSLYASGHTVYDVGARYHLDAGKLPVTLRASIHNLTNKAYWGMPQLSNLALGAPRTYMLSASFDF